MSTWRKIGRAFLYPHKAVLILLIPSAAALLILSLLFCDTESVPSYAAYALAAYTLTVSCLRIPHIIAFVKRIKRENKLLRRIAVDVRLRINLSLGISFFGNAAYACLQLGLAIRHASFWFYSLACYYLLLAFLRLYLVLHLRKHRPGEQMQSELQKHLLCGVLFLVMNLTLTLMIFFMIYWDRTFLHHEITTIALAAYTFLSFTVAIVNTVRYRRYQSPVISASRSISLAAACISMITLTSTMLTTFGNAGDTALRRGMLAGLGAAVSLFIIALATYMIVQSIKRMRAMRADKP